LEAERFSRNFQFDRFQPRPTGSKNSRIVWDAFYIVGFESKGGLGDDKVKYFESI